jgi:triosephosphate isomerase
MTGLLSAPFFEIGPKNLLRLAELEALVAAAAQAGADHGVAVVVTVPTAYIAPVVGLGTGALVFAQQLSGDGLGPSFGSVTAEALVDVGAHGVMLNHDSAPLPREQLRHAVGRATSVGLATIVCAGTDDEAAEVAALGPDVVLYEPPHLIGAAGGTDRPWITSSALYVHAVDPTVLMMQAGGVSSPGVAESIMAAGVDGTGSTSGVLGATDPAAAAREFISATRAGWDAAPAADRLR